MALNPMIPLSGQMPNFGATVRNAFERRDARQERERVANNEQAQIDANRNAQRLASVQAFAQRIKPLVDAGDIEGAGRALIQRRTELRNQAAQGIPVDSNETDDLVRALKTGGAQGLKKYIDATLSFGQPTPEGDAQIISGDQAVELGFRPGTVLKFRGGDYQVVQEPEKPATPLSETTINMPGMETEANRAFGRTVGERAATRIEAGQRAQTQNARLDRLALSLERGAETGYGEDVLLDLKNLGSTLFGLELTDEDSEQEVVRAIGNQLALEFRNPDGPLGGLPGSTSNRDINFLQASVPGLQRSEGGNRMMIDFLKRVNNLAVEVQREQDRILRDNNGNVPRDLDARLSQFVSDYELFTPAEREQIERVVSSTPPAERDDNQIDLSALPKLDNGEIDWPSVDEATLRRLAQ